MPFIHVKSLPFAHDVRIDTVVSKLTEDFARGTQIELKHVTATWEFLQPGHYAVAGHTSISQPAQSHPVLVDILAPDFNSAGQVETMLRTVAQSIAEHTHVPISNIFINHRQAHSGRVFDAGEVVIW